MPTWRLYTKRQEGKFIVTGLGSLPPNPLQVLPGTHTLTTLATLDADEISAKQRQVSKSELDKDKVEITEAQGLLKKADGSVELVAMAPLVTPRANGAVPTCPS